MTSKTLKGIYRCSRCGNLEAQEREITCWECGNGEMHFQSREAITEYINGWAMMMARAGRFLRNDPVAPGH
jgi:ribosomal protein L37E